MEKIFRKVPNYIEYQGSLYQLLESNLTHVEDICVIADCCKETKNTFTIKGGNVAQKD